MYEKNNELFEQYFYSYYERLHRYAFSIIKNDEGSKDVVQTVFLNLWQQPAFPESQQEIKSYLYTSVYNRCLNYLRDEKKRLDKQNGYARHTGSSQTNAATDKLCSDELALEIRNAINNLPPKCRQVFCKSRFENKKYQEIAAELDISVKTVEAQMGKALKTLRQLLSSNRVASLIYFALIFKGFING